MGKLAEIDEEDDVAWAARNEHWLARAGPSKLYRGRRERVREPLILCGHGVRLRIDHDTLLINDGFTHYPQQRQTYRFFKGDLNLPPRIVMLDGSGGLSFDVMRWLSEQSVPLIMLNYQGDVVSVIGGSGFAMLPDKVQWQIDTRNDPDQRLKYCCELISSKLLNSLTTLTNVIPDSSARAVAIARAEVSLPKLRSGNVETVDEIRMIEAAAAAAYFKSWHCIPLVWRSRWKYPVPDAWLTIGSRGSSGKGRAINNRNAKHPVNAMLNYAYGLLNSQVHIKTVAEGYDPRRGVMHHDRDDGGAFAWVFDLMELRRPLVDEALLRFILSTPINATDFMVRADGLCRLAPQFARKVCGSVIP